MKLFSNSILACCLISINKTNQIITIMKKRTLLLILFISTITTPIFSQIVIGGGISIDIKLPLPEVVIIGKTPRRAPTPQPRPRPRPRPTDCHSCDGNHHHENTYSYGEIQNQNGPGGRYIYAVQQAQLTPLNNGEEVVTYQLNSGDILELFIITANTNDYNYHSYADNCSCNHNNRITKVLLNGQYLPLRDGSLSLQPKNNGFHSVINLHSIHEGDFNGTVNF